MNRILSAVCAAIVLALVATASAGAETGNSAPIRELDDGGFVIGTITGPEAPEEYLFKVSLGEDQRLVQLTPTEVGVRDSSGVMGLVLTAGPMHDAEGAAVPVTLQLTGKDIVTETVDFRAGNPAAGFAAFRYPIVGGTGWEGGFHTETVEMNEHRPPAAESSPPAAPPPPPSPTCTVPSLRGYGLAAAKKILRLADCGIGKVRLSRGATTHKGKVVKQFEPAGTQLEAGAPVAIKLA